MTGLIFRILSVMCAVHLNFVRSAHLARDQLDSSAKCRSRYGYEYYYDHGTDHCEQCRDICQYAEITRTVQQCRLECPHYLVAMGCVDKEDQFYDKVLDKCSPCSELCDNHQVTGNTRECREHCNDYLEKLTPKQVPSHHKQNYLKAVDGSDAEQESQTSDLLLHPGWIAAMTVGGVALVCLVVVVIVLFWTCSQQQQQQQQYDPAPQQDELEGQMNRARRPVEETSQGSTGSQHFAIGGAPGALPPTVGLPDLASDGNHSVGDCLS